jgi:hypothetical protein
VVLYKHDEKGVVKMTLTREKLSDLVLREGPIAERAIGRALVLLLKRQTAEESASNDTRVHNAIGFTPADAYTGTLSAKFFIKHGRLEEWQIKKWQKLNAKGVPRIAKYWRQLAEEAEKKQKSQKTA